MVGLIKKVLLMLVLVSTSLCTFSLTYVSGTWSSDQTISDDIEVQLGSTLTIDPGVTITFTDNYYFKISGSIYAVGSSSSNRIIFTCNSYSGWKGVDVSNNTSRQVFVFCTIENVTKISGTCPSGFNGSGALYVYKCDDVVIRNCLFRYNNVCGFGGGLYVYDSGLTTSDNGFNSNIAETGGGMFISNCTHDFDGYRFNENNADYGGAAFFQDCISDITNGEFTLNEAILGAAIYFLSGSGQISGNFLEDNSATDKGGAIYAHSNTSIDIVDNSYNGNYANYGGGVFLDNTNVFIDDIIERNEAVYGGGLYVFESTYISFSSNTIIRNNEATNGGGIYCELYSDNLNDIIISYNYAVSAGGGIFLDQSDIDIQGSTISLNEADYGGGIYIYNSNINISNSTTFNFNQADHNGGGLFFEACSGGTIESSNITENSSFGNGGGMYIIDSDLNVNSCEINENYCNESGGGIYISTSDINIDFCLIENNTADYDLDNVGNGGGLYIEDDCYTWVQLSIFKNNYAYYGGGIYYYYTGTNPHQFCINNLIVLNEAESDGGGVFIDDNSVIYMTSNTIAGIDATHGDGGGIYSTQVQGYYYNNIIWENSSASTFPYEDQIGINLYNSGSYSNFSYNDIEGLSCPLYNNISQNPQFHKAYSGFAIDDYRLSLSHFPNQPTSNSPCIDAGTQNISAVTSVDLDNTSRIQGNDIDMGCYEHDFTYFIVLSNSEITTELFKVTAYYSVLTNTIQFKLFSEKEQDILIDIISSDSKLISHSIKKISKGTNLIRLNNNLLNKGIYYYRITTSALIFTDMFLIY